jgi:endonuclease/exonuclease/phosphatase family metal-dependent hydrolase
VLTVANFNMHAGIDGWGRPFDFMAACRRLDADIVMLEEVWTGDDDGPGGGQAEQVASALGYELTVCALAEGRRAHPDPAATTRWMPGIGLRNGHNSLFFDSERPASAAVGELERYREGELGSWGIALLTRQGMSIDRTHLVHLPRLARDRVRRVAIVTDLTVERVPLSVAGTHMSHLYMGSHLHYAALRTALRIEARPNAVLLGDMNLWGPPVRAFLPEWHRAVKGRTWPAWNPHSQIDHVLVRGALGISSGQVLPDAGSDHRPVRAELTVQ